MRCRCASPPPPWPRRASRPAYIGGGGGSDANVFNARGLPALTLGVGFERVHSPQECIRLERLEQLYRLGHALVRAAGRTPA